MKADCRDRKVAANFAWHGCGMFALIVIVLAARADAGSIFDDDWVAPASTHSRPDRSPAPSQLQPPPASSPTKPAPVQPTEPGVVRPPPTPNPNDPLPGIPQPGHRRSIPSKAEQANSRALFKTFYAPQLGDRSMPARRNLAQALLDDAVKIRGNAVDEFVLLTGAIVAAQEGGSLDLCFRAADELANQYEIDGLSVKADAAVKLQTNKITEAECSENIHAGLDLVDELNRADGFTEATRVAGVLQQLASRDPSLRSAVQERIKQTGDARVAHEKVATHFQKLETSPNDPVSNTAVGEYFCFVKSDWNSGLRYLSRGSDVELSALAQRELTATTPEAKTAIAGAWWDAAEKGRPGVARKGPMQTHAQVLYSAVLPSLPDGLLKRLAEERVSSLRLDPGATVDLLNFLEGDDMTAYALAGRWSIEKIAAGGKNERSFVVEPVIGGQLAIPVRIRGSYVINVSFRRLTGNDAVQVSFPVGDRMCSLVMSGWFGGAGGLSEISGRAAIDNRTKIAPDRLVNDRIYFLEIQVAADAENGGIVVLRDGKKFTQWAGKLSSLGLQRELRIADKKNGRDKQYVGLSAWNSRVRFEKVTLKLVKGSAQKFKVGELRE